MSQFYDPQSALPPRKRSNTALIIVVVVLLVVAVMVAAMVGLGFLVYRMQQSFVEAMSIESFDPAEADPAKADKVSDKAVERVLVAALMQRMLGEAVDPWFSDEFDLNRMALEIERTGFQVSREEGYSRYLGVELALTERLENLPEFAYTSKHELRDLEFLPRRGEALATIRCRFDDGTSRWLHWWLRKSDGRWRIYDMQSLKGGVQFSTSMATGQEGFEPLDDAQKMQAVRALVDASRAIDDERYDDAERLLRESLELPLEGELAQSRWMMLAHAAVEQEFDEEALQWLDKLDGIRNMPPPPFADYFRAVAYNRLGRPAEALAHAEGFMEALGEEADARLEAGRALRALGRRDEAASAFRKGLADYPDSADSLVELAALLETTDLPELGNHLARFTKPRDHFENIAEALIARGERDALDALVQRYRRLAPDDPDSEYYGGVVLADRGEYQQAAALFLRGMKRADAEDREFYVDRYVDAMLAVDKPLEAYRAVPGGPSFRRLARKLTYVDNSQPLEELIALHRAREPRDAWLAFYEAHLKIDREEFRAAADVLRPALQRVDGEALEEFKAVYYQAASQAGMALEVYREADDRGEAFRELAARAQYREPPALVELIEAHRRNDPRDPWLAFYEGVVDREAGRYDEAADHFRGLWDRAVEEPDRAQFVAAWLHAMQLAGRPVEGYRALDDKREAFAVLAGNLWDAEDLAALEQLIEVHGGVHPQHAWLAYYRGELAGTRRQYDEAADHYRDAWKRAEEYERWRFVNSYLTAMRLAGRAPEGYRAAPDPGRAFRYLAYDLAEEGDAEPLAALIAAHEAVRPSDPELAFYRARAHVLAGDYDAADRAFAAAWEAAEDASQRNRIRWQRVRARHRAGRGLSAYGEIEPADATFRQLAWLLLEDKDAEQLAALVAARRRDVAADPDLPRWEIEVRWLKRDYAGVLERLKQREDEFVADDWWWFDEKRVRAHLRLRQFDEALQAAEVSRGRDDDPFIVAVVHAAAGNAAAFQKAAEDCIETGDYPAADFYEDEDAGPALAGEAFAEFRKKYPPEKKPEEE